VWEGGRAFKKGGKTNDKNNDRLCREVVKLAKRIVIGRKGRNPIDGTLVKIMPKAGNPGKRATGTYGVPESGGRAVAPPE